MNLPSHPLDAVGVDEETARSEVYGLLALLYYAPPAIEWLAKLRLAPTPLEAGGSRLQAPWRGVVALARELSDAAIAAEYDALFGGIGKPEVYLYGSHFLSGFLNEKPLARLRADLAGLGLQRAASMSETEDHFAYLCEVMRHLIAASAHRSDALLPQRAFFLTHIQPWARSMCEAIERHPQARFYRAVAGFTGAFLDVEAQGFDMLE